VPDTKDEPSNAGNQRNPIFRNWTSGDSKLLVITIAATVAANLITAVIIALAIIVARSMRPHPATPGNYAFLFGASLFPLLAVWAVLFFFRVSRHEKNRDLLDQTLKWTLIIVGTFEGMFALSYILAFIGFAIGIK
jgi:hypothetical protein